MQNLGLLQSFKRFFTGGPNSEQEEAKSDRFVLEGSLARGASTKYAIDGHDFRVDDDTWIFGDVTLGSYVVVQGTFDIDNVRYARKITLKNKSERTRKRKKATVRVQQ